MAVVRHSPTFPQRANVHPEISVGPVRSHARPLPPNLAPCISSPPLILDEDAILFRGQDTALDRENNPPLSFSAPPVRKNRLLITGWLRFAKNAYQEPWRPAHRLILSRPPNAEPWAIHSISLRPATPFPTGDLPNIFTGGRQPCRSSQTGWS